MDEKSVRNSQRVLLAALTARDSRLNNAIFALIQRLIINMPDRVDDRKNTIECLMTLLLSRSDMEKRRIDAWILLCARCGIANIRLCAVSLARSLLMSRYVWARSEDGVKNAEDGVENNKEDNKNMDNHNTTTHQQDPSAMEIEPSPNSPSHQEEKMEEEIPSRPTRTLRRGTATLLPLLLHRSRSLQRYRNQHSSRSCSCFPSFSPPTRRASDSLSIT